jgi:hypothetical protein
MRAVIGFPMHTNKCFPIAIKELAVGQNGGHNITVRMNLRECLELNDADMTGVKLLFKPVNGKQIETPYMDFQKQDQVLAKFEGKKCRIDLVDGLPYNMLCKDL